MAPDAPDNFMQKLPHYQAKYDAAKKIHVYFIPAVDERTREKLYFYAIASEMLHEHMMRCIQDGDIPHYAVVVEKGSGEPTAEVKAKIKAYYGFDHDAAANDPSSPP